MTGATGYLGGPLVTLAAARGHRVRAFVRPGSEASVPRGVTIVRGDALAARDLITALAEGDTLVHLVGTPRPSPAKAQQFLDVDLASIRTACEAACPAEAIVFGDLNDPESRVAKSRKEPRSYGLLTELQTRPRTTYQAAVRNPNPEMPGASKERAGASHG